MARSFPPHPFDPVAPSTSANVPMMIGSTFHEFCISAYHEEFESKGEDELKRRVADIHGEKAGRIVEAYRKAHPNSKPVEILSFITNPRSGVVAQAERKAALNAAPVYVYWFGVSDAHTGREAARLPLPRYRVRLLQYGRRGDANRGRSGSAGACREGQRRLHQLCAQG